MSNSEKPGRELTPEEAARLSVEVIAAAGQAVEEKHGADAGAAYRQVVTGMGRKLQELLEWKAKAENKILELGAKAQPKLTKTHIEWIRVTCGMKAEANGCYVADGEEDTEISNLRKGDSLEDVFQDCGDNLHIAGPFDLPREDYD